MGGITGPQMQRFELKSRPDRTTNYPLLIKSLLRLWRSTLGQHCCDPANSSSSRP